FPTRRSSDLALSQVISFSSMRSFICAERNRLRRRIGYFERSSVRRWTKRTSQRLSSASLQSTQLISLSWQYALLLPRCVRANSSPASSIGVPCESSKLARKLRICRRRNSSTAGSSVSPSAPQFHERLSEVPSRLSSPFASL